MNLQELVGSLLVLGFRGDSLNNPQTREDIKELKAIHAKGVILFDHDIKANAPRNIRSPKQLTKLIEDLKNELGEDLIIAIDQEGGKVSRLAEANGFLPTLSAADFANLEEIDQIQYADKQAKQLSKLGINLNLSPCVDLMIEPSSPIIAGKDRSFGETVEQVVGCAQIMIDAHNRANVRCCIKHFPGHGSSLLDSHHNICDITNTHTADETRVFAQLTDHYHNQIAVMCGHLMHMKHDPELPASLSQAITTGLLRQELGFEGVVMTDSLDMRAIRNNFGEGESAVSSINAGADIVLDGINARGYRQEHAATAIAFAIASGVTNGTIQGDSDRLIQSQERVHKWMCPR